MTGTELRRIREEMGMSRTAFGDVIDRTRQMVQMYEDDRKEIPPLVEMAAQTAYLSRQLLANEELMDQLRGVFSNLVTQAMKSDILDEAEEARHLAEYVREELGETDLPGPDALVPVLAVAASEVAQKMFKRRLSDVDPLPGADNEQQPMRVI